MGARKIVVASLGPLGCIPSKRLQRGSGSAGCSEELNADSRLFNAAVLAMVKQLNAELPGALFHYQDAYKGVMDIVSDPSRYGFTIVDRGCCVVEGDFFFMTQCLLFFTPCTNRNDYLFWDAFHPSDKANVALSLKFWESTEYMYPMSLKELFFL